MQNMTAMTEEQYATHWTLESAKHQRFSDYSWMSKILNDQTSILEIGCGDGTSTSNLLRKKCKVVIIEANQTLANAAFGKLSSLGHTGKIAFKTDEIDNELEFNIVVGSVFSPIAEEIVKSFNFDYIINWLFGASPYTIAVEEEIEVSEVTIELIPEYREKSALRSLELKKMCINTKCKFHYVLRASYNKDHVTGTNMLKSSFAQEQSEHLGLMPNEIDDTNIEIRKSESSSRQSSSAMKYVHTLPGTSLPPNIKSVFVSILI